MALTVADLADLAEHISARRRLYALALAADIELLRRAYGESVVQEALRLADEAAQPKQAPQTPSGGHAREIADALNRVIAERLPTVVAHDKAGVQFLDRPRRREAARATQ